MYDWALSGQEVAELSDKDAPLHTDAHQIVAGKQLGKVGDVTISEDKYTFWDYDGTVTWRADEMDEIAIAADGVNATVKQPAAGSAPVTGKLTAVAAYRGTEASKQVNVTIQPFEAVNPDDPYGYLMVHFVNGFPDGYLERIFLDISQGDDPMEWRPLNGGQQGCV